MENRNRQVLLKQRPTGVPTPADFAIVDAPLPDPAAGEVLVRGIYLSLDPYMRGRISGQRSYARPVEVGEDVDGQQRRLVGAEEEHAEAGEHDQGAVTQRQADDEVEHRVQESGVRSQESGARVQSLC